MNNIRRDEIDKIKRRRKRKSNKLLIGTKPSKALIAFNKHIEATKSDIEKSRLNYSNDTVNRKKSKLTLGIFDNAVCSKNIENILQQSIINKNKFFKLPIVNHKLEKEIERDMSINETLHELADKCRQQLNIRYCVGPNNDWVNNTPGMMRLRAAKADAYRNNRLELIDCGINKMENRRSVIVEKLIELPTSDNVIEMKQQQQQHLCEKQAQQPSLSASTSIANCRRISFLLPPRPASSRQLGKTQRKTRKSNIVANGDDQSNCEPIHPLWDTPEELRTSHLGAFAAAADHFSSIFRDNLSCSQSRCCMFSELNAANTSNTCNNGGESRVVCRDGGATSLWRNEQ